ncbi:MAG TPA: ABC transporter substrate-binding protein [Acidimicrobiales bacterium]
MPTPPRSARRTWRALLGTLVVGLVLLAACSSDAPTSDAEPPPSSSDPVETGPSAGGTLDIAVPTGPMAWSPAGPAWTSAELQAARAVYDRLLVRDANDIPAMELADKVQPNADYTVWTISLRPGVTFHDGTPFDAAAVAANLEAQRLAPDAAALLDPIETITTVGSVAVVLTMNSPWSTFPQVLTTQVGTIAAPAVLDGRSSTPIGTGPFAFASAGLDGSIELTRNPAYWKAGLPYLDAVRLVPMADASARVDAVLGGTADMVSVDEPRQLTRLDDLPEDGAVTLHEDRNGERPKVAIAFETGRPPFDHITARRAVVLATDRQVILEKVFDGQGSISRGIISDASPWFSDHSSPSRDISRAKEQAEKYTEDTGEDIEFTMLVPPDPTIAHVASMWRLQLAEAGIDVQLQPVAADALDAAMVFGQYQSAIVDGFASPHPDLYEPLLRGIPAEQPVVSSNYTRYVNPIVTEAYADARATGDATRQVDDYRIVQEQLSIDNPWLFLVQVRSVVLASSSLRDVTEWTAGSGSAALSEEAATVSLAQIWIDE